MPGGRALCFSVVELCQSQLVMILDVKAISLNTQTSRNVKFLRQNNEMCHNRKLK